MSKGPKISIITACYNAEATIEQTIQSVLSQTYDNIEYIIVDGASTDSTMNIVNKYRNRINIIISEPDDGIYDAFNKGAKAATGEYIQYLNADDYYYSLDILERISNEFIKYSDLAMLYGGVKTLDETTGYFYYNCKERSINDLVEKNMIPHQSIFIKREVMRELGFFNLQYKICSDYEMICKVYLEYAQKIKFIPVIVAVFRVGGVSSDFKNKKNMVKEFNLIGNDLFGVDIEQSIYPSTEKLLKIWIEKVLFNDYKVFEEIVNLSHNKVVLWGTGEVSTLLLNEAKKNNIEVVSFIDNDIRKQGDFIKEVMINKASWLKDNLKEYDCIILAFEGQHEESVLKQINTLNLDKEVINWKDLILN